MQPGNGLGHYEILSAIGKGGMGEVWKARDTTLGREVAIKTLPEEFARDANRLARFEREARLLASLNHPNIAAVHGFQQDKDTHFLVMELVEGPTLADRLEQGAIPVEESLRLALQIAEALEAAHEKGVIHRDLKPANIKITPEGTVKVLDFGLAKAFEGRAADANLSNSPTLSMAATQQGVILGTAAYMSPEQAKGQSVDTRADVWAFGCVLYEMLAGRQVFAAEDVSTILARVLDREPDFALLPAGLHPRLGRLLRRCLEKDRKRRYHDVADVRLDLEEVLSDPEDVRVAAGTGAATPGSATRWPWITAAAVTAVLAAIAFFFLPETPEAPVWAAEPVRFELYPPQGTTFYNVGIPFAVSHDGRQIAFAARTLNGGSQLWLRALETSAARPLAGTEGARSPFWSPDSEWIGFFTDDALRRVPASGGEALTITRILGNAPSLEQATWGDDGTIVFRTSMGGALSQVSVRDGAVTPATVLQDGDQQHAWPRFLQDGRHFLYRGSLGGRNALDVGSVNGGAPRRLLELGPGGNLGYMPGFLLYAEADALFARPFNQETLGFSGDPVRILDEIPNSGPGIVPFSVSSNGVLAFWTEETGEPAEFRWIERDGTESDPLTAPATYSGWDLAPDEMRIAFSRFGEAGRRDIWIRDLARGDEQPLTADGDSLGIVWSPDVESVMFASARANAPDLFRMVLNTGTEERFTQTFTQVPVSWEPDGTGIVYVHRGPEGIDLWRLSLDDMSMEALPVNTEFSETDAQVSSDGRWIAYVSNASGRPEVILAGYPSGQPRRTVSVGGGIDPEWRADGRELFYVSADRQLMAVPVATHDTGFDVGEPEALFPVPRAVDASEGNSIYSPTADGQRFLFLLRPENPETDPIQVILNWPAILDGSRAN